MIRDVITGWIIAIALCASTVCMQSSDEADTLRDRAADLANARAAARASEWASIDREGRRMTSFEVITKGSGK